MYLGDIKTNSSLANYDIKVDSSVENYDIKTGLTSSNYDIKTGSRMVSKMILVLVWVWYSWYYF